MKFFLHPQAQEELEKIILFYKKQQAGLEKRLIEAVEDAINKACRNPLSGNVDFCIFPYAIIFRTTPEQIAVMHLRKQPTLGNHENSGG
jgi:plasmid stabilization system protein ParE